MAIRKRIFIVEDHQLFREGLKALLESIEEWQVVGEAGDGLQAVEHVPGLQPDLVLLDLSMPKMNGFSVLVELKRVLPELKVLVLSIHESDQYVLQAFESGANGYCNKDCSRDELRLAVRSVLEGRRYISPGIADSVLEGYLEGRKTLKSKSRWDAVTLREREVLKLLAEGHTNKEIARMLNISVKTVEKHRANIMQKLDLHNAASLTAYACQKGLVAPAE
jgi:DNA-binding NarL/FixJ family response regulator